MTPTSSGVEGGVLDLHMGERGNLRYAATVFALSCRAADIEVQTDFPASGFNMYTIPLQPRSTCQSPRISN